MQQNFFDKAGTCDSDNVGRMEGEDNNKGTKGPKEGGQRRGGTTVIQAKCG